MPLLEIDGPRFGPASGGTPDSLIVLLHGVGADGNDLIELAPILGEHLPGTAFVSPHAPFPYDGAPMGRQWFSLMERTQEMMLAGVRASAPILDAFLDEELARLGLADDRLGLVGFSQGTMMSLYVAPRRAKPIAGVVGFSGRAGRAPTCSRARSSRARPCCSSTATPIRSCRCRQWTRAPRPRRRRHRGRGRAPPRPAALDRPAGPGQGAQLPARPLCRETLICQGVVFGRSSYIKDLRGAGDGCTSRDAPAG